MGAQKFPIMFDIGAHRLADDKSQREITIPPLPPPAGKIAREGSGKTLAFDAIVGR